MNDSVSMDITNQVVRDLDLYDMDQNEIKG